MDLKLFSYESIQLADHEIMRHLMASCLHSLPVLFFFFNFLEILHREYLKRPPFRHYLNECFHMKPLLFQVHATLRKYIWIKPNKELVEDQTVYHLLPDKFSFRLNDGRKNVVNHLLIGRTIHTGVLGKIDR